MTITAASQTRIYAVSKQPQEIAPSIRES